MNLKEEFKEAQGWVKESLNFDINKVMTTIVIVSDKIIMIIIMIMIIKESLNFDINKVVTILITIVIDFDKIITIIMIIIMIIMIIIMMIIKDVGQASECFRLFTP